MEKRSKQSLWNFAGDHRLTRLSVVGILQVCDLFLSVSRKDDHNLIGFVGGKVDEGETIEDAIIRETLEETGLHAEIDRDIIPYVARDVDFLVYCFILKLRDIEHNTIAERETGLIRLSSKQQLIDNSPYSEYNIGAFEWFGL